MSDDNKKRFMEMAESDKKRYEAEIFSLPAVSQTLRRSERILNVWQMEEMEARQLANDDENLGLEVALIGNKGRG